jgi:hypothetical protein
LVRANYWKGISPDYRFLKEFLREMKRERVKEMVDKIVERRYFDKFFLNEIHHFLRLSIINLLSYKYLMCGNYYAWGNVSLYYGYFYIINCLLRMQKFAIVHINFFQDTLLIIIIDRYSNPNYYIVKNCRGREHQILWNTFEQYYRNLSSDDIGEFFRVHRNEWNYDPFYASQTTNRFSLYHAKKSAKIIFMTLIMELPPPQKPQNIIMI